VHSTVYCSKRTICFNTIESRTYKEIQRPFKRWFKCIFIKVHCTLLILKSVQSVFQQVSFNSPLVWSVLDLMDSSTLNHGTSHRIKREWSYIFEVTCEAFGNVRLLSHHNWQQSVAGQHSTITQFRIRMQKQRVDERRPLDAHPGHRCRRLTN